MALIGSGCAPTSACSGCPTDAGSPRRSCPAICATPRYGRVLADLLVEGTHTVDDLTARLTDLGAAPSEVPPPLDRRFQGGLLDTEVALRL